MKQILLLAGAILLLQGCSTTGTFSNAKPYPLDNCIVSENELGSMGKPVQIVHEGQLIIFCCKPCINKFKKNPAKYLVRLKQ